MLQPDLDKAIDFTANIIKDETFVKANLFPLLKYILCNQIAIMQHLNKIDKEKKNDI